MLAAVEPGDATTEAPTTQPVRHGSAGRWDRPVDDGIPEGAAIPKYYAAKIELTALLDGLGVGAALPAERALAARMGVSRETLRAALQELTVEGRLRREGRNTVVSGPKLEQPLALGSYTEALAAQGMRPGRRLVRRETLAAHAQLAADLAVPPTTAVVHLERILLIDDEPIGLESTYLPQRRVPQLERDFDPGTSLYAYLRAVGIELACADERIETVLATPREAALLASTPALPMLLLTRISRDGDGVPVECVRTLFRGDRFRLTARHGSS
jgi:GntR family transcriptional regulator